MSQIINGAYDQVTEGKLNASVAVHRWAWRQDTLVQSVAV